MPESAQTFQGAIERAKSWSSFQFNETEARLLMEHCIAVLRSPDDHPKLAKLWNVFIEAEQPKIRERLENTEWGSTGGRALVLLSVMSLEIRNGIRHFLPPLYDDVLRDEDNRRALWCWYLLNQGRMLQPEEPFCLLQPSALLFMAGPYASREIAKRAAQHPLGFAAATFGYFSKSDDREMAGVDEIMIDAVKRIARTARKKIPAAMRPKQDDGKTAPGVADAKLAPLDVHVAETLLKELADVTAEEVVARSLDGLLNIIPAAAAMDVIDKNKSQQSNFERAVDCDSDNIEDVVNRLYQAASTAKSSAKTN